MSAPAGLRFKLACYTLEGINSFATILYFNYLYFLLRDHFGFDNKHNLCVAAWLGLTYAFAAWQAGKFAQRRGYFTSLKTGFSLMILGLAAGSQLHSLAGQLAAATVTNVGMCFIWPTLEALTSESEPATQLPNVVGLYNVVWAVTNALAFFIGGALIHLGGYPIIYLLPLGLVLCQMALTFWLQHHATELARKAVNQPHTAPPPPDPHRPSPQQARTFLRMAWLANPFAYIAINTLIAVVPGIAAKFQLSTMAAGFICTLWCFVRLGAFAALWHWTGWHYKFRWLAASFAALIVSFAAILMSPNLVVLIVAQVFFGVAIGLIYYSSLFYSMDASDTRSEHGGIHEAAIGVGNCLGPAIGALSLQFLPGVPNVGAMAVSVLLLCGFGGLVAIWRRDRRSTETN